MKKYPIVLIFFFLMFSFFIGKETGAVGVEITPISVPWGNLLHVDVSEKFTGVLYERKGFIYYKQMNTDGEWDDELFIGEGSQGKLKIDIFNDIHIVYTTNSGEIAYIAYKYDLTSDQYWFIDTLYISSENGGECYWPYIDVDSLGDYYITYVDTMGKIVPGIDDYPDIVFYYKNEKVIYPGNEGFFDPGTQQGSFPAEKAPLHVLDEDDSIYDIYHWRQQTGDEYYRDISIWGGYFIIASSTEDKDIFDIYQMLVNDSTLYVMYREDTNTKIIKMFLLDGDIVGFEYVLDIPEVFASSFAVSGENIVIGGKYENDLIYYINGERVSPEEIDVSDNFVSVVFANELFKAFYTPEAVDVVLSEISATSIYRGDSLASSTLTGIFRDPKTDEIINGNLSWEDDFLTLEDTANFNFIFSASGTVAYNDFFGSVEVSRLNRLPLASSTDFSLLEGDIYSGVFLVNDPDGDELSFEITREPQYGIIEIGLNGDFQYRANRQPTIGFVGEDSFSFRAFDGEMYSDEIENIITISEINDSPEAVTKSFTVRSGRVYDGQLSGSDIDGDILTYSLVEAPSNINIEIGLDGKFTFSSHPSFSGEIFFTFKVSDGLEDSEPAYVYVTVSRTPSSGGGSPLPFLRNDSNPVFQTYDPLKDELTIYNDEDVIVLGIEEEFVEKSEAESIFESITNKKYLLEMILGEENTEGEANIPTKYSKLFKERKDSEDNKYKKITNFIFYGTETTIKLGEGERAGVVNSYKSAFGKLPETVSDWEDIIKIANGRWTSEINEVAEEKAKSKFRQIYLRDANRENAHDDAALVVIAYGLRPSDRNIQSEKNAIGFFRGIFGYAPDSATDWDIVRAIAYSGAKR